MDIKEYWAKQIDLFKDYNNVNAYYVDVIHNEWQIFMWNNKDDGLIRSISIKNLIDGLDYETLRKSTKIQLRRDGIDIYTLEWRKPTELDIGKSVWAYDNSFDIAMLLEGVLTTNCLKLNDGVLYLLADHGQICPTEQDFNKVYGW